MKFDRKKFFSAYRLQYGKLTQQQTDGLSRLLSCIEADPYIKRITEAAYILANVKHETADTFTPIHEYGGKSYFIKRYGSTTKVGRSLGNDTPEEGYYYAGKGDTQTTGETNYEKAEEALRKQYPEVVAAFEARTGKHFDLTVGDQPNDTSDPQNMLDPAISYAVMSYGMRTGMFTGKKLSDYITATKTDYKNARRIINGTDKASLIAGYAEQFEQILKSSAAHQTATHSTENHVVKPTDDTVKQKAQADELPIPQTQIAETIVNTGATSTAPVPDGNPVTVTVERVSIWAKLGAGFAGLTGLGINFATVIENKLNEINVVQLGYALGALGLIAVALYLYDRAAKRAHEKTLAKVETASDPAKNTVELRERVNS